MKEGKLILLRHGQSLWNKKNLFTGWVDVPLSIEGIEEANLAGKKLAQQGIDIIFTSTLIRSIMTALIAMAHHESQKSALLMHENNEWGSIHSLQTEKDIIPVHSAYQLNERMYGKLQGLNKDQVRQQYGDEQVKLWRRSYDVPPPDGESLQMTSLRTLPYFQQTILPLLSEGKNVLIAAHGNSIRSIVMFLESIPAEKIHSLEIGFAEPLIYTFDGTSWKR